MLNNFIMMQGFATFSIILIGLSKLKCMKKKFFALMLIAVGLPFTVVSCSSDDDVCIEDYVVSTVNVDNEISSFLNSQCAISKDTGNDRFFPFSDKDECYIVNNESEFRAIYVGEDNEPSINYDNYSLLIGRIKVPHTGYHIDKITLIQQNKLILNINVRENEAGYTAITNLYFWGFYHKLPSLPLETNIIITN